MKPPERIVVDARRLAGMRERLKRRELIEEDYALLEGMLETWQYFCSAVERKTLTITRLQRMLFGPSTEKTEKLLNQARRNKSPPDGAAAKGKAKGHGRHGVDSYWGAKRVRVMHQSLKVGDRCGLCGKGTLYELKPPSRVVVFRAEAPIQATVYECQRLRCSACGAVSTAELPEEAGTEKYHASAGSMVALLKYGNGFPFYRLGQLQKSVGIPFPPAIQWELVKQKAEVLLPVWEELLREAAQGEVLHNDDTYVTILQLLKDRSYAPEHTDGEQPADAAKRSGMFTTAIVSSSEKRRPIALFHSGIKHAGENTAELLRRRGADRDAPILMCDALSRNVPKAFPVILANCLAHGRRYFVDLLEAFPAECEYVLEILRDVYLHDKRTKQLGLSAEERLAYHQSHSKALMDELHAWLNNQFGQKKVEPNSSLGEAISYMLRHWKALTQFLRVPGAPLDNTACERTLKRAILNRKNSLFYKTCNGAQVGDILMSVIYTCILSKINPFEYLTETEKHAGEVAENPQAWLPWNYQNEIHPEKAPQAKTLRA